MAELSRQNNRLLTSSAKVQEDVEKTASANAQLIHQARESSGAMVTWGVVYGGDRNLEGAQYEVSHIAARYGFDNAAIYFRRGTYRSVATTTNRLEAQRILKKAKERREDAYIVNMSTWCPETIMQDEFFECSNT